MSLLASICKTDIDGIRGITDAESPEDNGDSFDDEITVDQKLCKKPQTAKNENPTVGDEGILTDEEMQQVEITEDSSISQSVTDAKG